MPAASTPWDEFKVEELKRLWADGCSARDIAKQLGDGIGRCAVLGKVNRLGLERRKEARPYKPRAVTIPRGRPILRRPVFKKDKPVLDGLIPEPIAAKPRRLQLLQLAEHHCRWPIGDPRTQRFYFCAANRELGVPYCPYHMHKAFAKPRGR